MPPGQHGKLNQPPDNTTAPTPDNSAIVQTAGQVNQKSSVPLDAPPTSNVPPTTVTAVDGDIVNATVASVAASGSRRRRNLGRLGKRQTTEDNYAEIFAPKAAGVHDASIEGTAYLTYTVVSNATYNIKDCLAFCDKVDGCGTFAPCYPSNV